MSAACGVHVALAFLGTTHSVATLNCAGDIACHLPVSTPRHAHAHATATPPTDAPPPPEVETRRGGARCAPRARVFFEHLKNLGAAAQGDKGEAVPLDLEWSHFSVHSTCAVTPSTRGRVTRTVSRSDSVSQSNPSHLQIVNASRGSTNHPPPAHRATIPTASVHHTHPKSYCTPYTPVVLPCVLRSVLPGPSHPTPSSLHAL